MYSTEYGNPAIQTDVFYTRANGREIYDVYNELMPAGIVVLQIQSISGKQTRISHIPEGNICGKTFKSSVCPKSA
jgi:hypothetical protein